MWDAELGSVILPTVSTMIVFVITINLVRYLMGDDHLHLRDVSKHHNWTTIAGSNKAYYCSICEALILNMNGVICDSCGVCSDRNCIKHADQLLKCKAITLPRDEPMKHHWIKGNLPPSAMCDVCEDECDTEIGLVNFCCCWCQRCVHESCKSAVSTECDFGEFKLMIIPPGSLEVVNKRSTMRRRLRLRSIVPPVWPDWKPLIIVGEMLNIFSRTFEANKKSGNNEGAKILSMFRRLVNPAQVVDLSERDPVAALEWCRLLGENPCNVLVAGGDGTIAWLLSAIHKLRLKPEPSVAILPLGTGNDLSRVLNWGKGYSSDLEANEILHRVQTARHVKLDRWAVTIKPDARSLGFRGSQQRIFMYNYMSVGVDAQVTLNFHRTRESRFYLFSHRIFNKLLYLCFGTQQVVERECKDLDRRIEVYLDDKQIVLPSIESIVILNIPYWGAGVKLWEMGLEGTDGFGVQSINDEKLEVVAIYSSFHIAQLQVGLSQPHRLGQAHTVKVKLLDSCAVQIDGEPWHQNPCEFVISHCNQASMLACTK